MDQIPPPALSDIELDALRQIAAHPATRHIPAHIQSGWRILATPRKSWGPSFPPMTACRELRRAN